MPHRDTFHNSTLNNQTWAEVQHNRWENIAKHTRWSIPPVVVVGNLCKIISNLLNNFTWYDTSWFLMTKFSTHSSPQSSQGKYSAFNLIFSTWHTLLMLFCSSYLVIVMHSLILLLKLFLPSICRDWTRVLVSIYYRIYWLNIIRKTLWIWMRKFSIFPDQWNFAL